MNRDHGGERVRLLWLLALLGACGAGEAPEADPWRLAEARLTEASVLEAPHAAEALRAEGLGAARAALTLRSSGRRFEATDAYACRQLEARGEEPARRCRAVVADDTIHTTEFPPFAVARLDPSIPIRLEGLEGLEVLHVEIGEPSAMHRVGYAQVEAVRLEPRGGLEIARPEAPRGDELLMVTVRRPGGPWIFKLVWVIERLALGERGPLTPRGSSSPPARQAPRSSRAPRPPGCAPRSARWRRARGP